MPGTFVIVLDGVLRKKGSDAVNLQGMALYHSLIEHGRVAVLCGPDKERDDWFLRVNGMNKHAHLIPEDETTSSTKEGRRLAQISYLRQQATHVEFVIETDPDIAAHLLQASVPVLVYLHPQYTEPAFRPDYKAVPTPWENLLNEVQYQEEMRAANPILTNNLDDD